MKPKKKYGISYKCIRKVHLNNYCFIIFYISHIIELITIVQS